MRTIRSQTGTKVTHVGSSTETKFDRSEFIFRPVPCERMKGNLWRPIRTHTGLSSSRSTTIRTQFKHHRMTYDCTAAVAPRKILQSRSDIIPLDSLVLQHESISTTTLFPFYNTVMLSTRNVQLQSNYP